jgi:hypothetical protein
MPESFVPTFGADDGVAQQQLSAGDIRRSAVPPAIPRRGHRQ